MRPPRDPAGLPPVGGGLVGRERELNRISAVLMGPARLVTLTGPGGIGKTRLAEEAARRLHRARRTPVFVARLANGSDAAVVREAVTAAVLVGGFVGASAWDGALQRLSDVDRAGRVVPTVLLLDNCEHVQAGVVAVIADLLDAVPGLTVLATSREPVVCADDVPIQDCDAASGNVGADQAGVRLARAEIRELLARLVERSLVSVHMTVDAVRYFLLESLRLFAEDRLAQRSIAEVDEPARLVRRHCCYCPDRVLYAHIEWFGPAEQQLLSWAMGAWSNIRRAIDTSISIEQPVVGLAWLFLNQGLPQEAEELLERSVAACDARAAQGNWRDRPVARSLSGPPGRLQPKQP